MLKGTQLKLCNRRSGQLSSGMKSQTAHVPMVLRPCFLKNINDEPSKIENVYPTPEIKPPELRVVSLNLEDDTFNIHRKKIIKSPRRMPLYCAHLKRVRQNTHRDEIHFDDEFLVKGVEVRIDSDRNDSFRRQRADEASYVTLYDDQDRDECKFVEDGIKIQLTDCCQCVCDLYNRGFQISHEFSFVPVENCSAAADTQLRSARMKETPRQLMDNVLDPNILKVIRVTMNTKKVK